MIKAVAIAACASTALAATPLMAEGEFKPLEQFRVVPIPAGVEISHSRSRSEHRALKYDTSLLSQVQIRRLVEQICESGKAEIEFQARSLLDWVKGSANASFLCLASVEVQQ